MEDDGRSAAFTALYEEHQGAVWRYARRRVTSAEQARDVVADTFLVAWRRFADVPDQPLPWLYGVAANVLANQTRKHRRSGRLVGRIGHDLMTEPDAPDHAGGVVSRLWVAAALSRLRPRDQEVLWLVAWEGLSGPEAARVLGCSKTAFAVRLHRARRRLERELAAGDAAEETPAQIMEEHA